MGGKVGLSIEEALHCDMDEYGMDGLDGKEKEVGGLQHNVTHSLRGPLGDQRLPPEIEINKSGELSCSAQPWPRGVSVQHPHQELAYEGLYFSSPFC